MTGAGRGGEVTVVGSCLLHNEDVFCGQAISNVLDFCDRIHVCDHMSRDGTWEIVSGLAREHAHVEAFRSRNAADSHAVLQQYAGSNTWVLAIDGDELYDPVGLSRLRSQLACGDHADVFRLTGHVLHADELDPDAGTAVGWMAPPSRPVTKFFNFAVIDGWTGCLQRLHGGTIAFRGGHTWDSRRYLSADTGWSTDPLRLLHTCFLSRSSADSGIEVRRNLTESWVFRRDLVGAVRRGVARVVPGRGVRARSTRWKSDWYARGERVSIDATPFFPPVRRS